MWGQSVRDLEDVLQACSCQRTDMASFSFGSLLQMLVRLTVITQDLTCTLFLHEVKSHVRHKYADKNCKKPKGKAGKHACNAQCSSVTTSQQAKCRNRALDITPAAAVKNCSVFQSSPLRRCCSAHNCCPLLWQLCFPSLSKFKSVE